MASMTLAVPAELKKDMDEFPEMNWSAVAREAIRKKIEILKKVREFTAESELTEEDAIRIGREVKKAVAERHKK